MPTKAIALHSGGLDSTVAAHLAMREVEIACALTFDYGQRARKRETIAAGLSCEAMGVEHRIVELPWLAEATRTALVNEGEAIPSVSPDALGEGDDERAAAVWVPNRNGVLIAAAAAIAEGMGVERIVAGFNAEEAEAFPDNSAPFVEATNEALEYSTRNSVKLMSPTLHMTKGEIAHQFVLLDLEPDSFWCCYEGGERLCGKCESCARTIRAFRQEGAWAAISDRFA